MVENPPKVLDFKSYKMKPPNPCFKKIIKTPFFLCLLFIGTNTLFAYPIDGYKRTKIRRLLQLQLIEKGELDGKFRFPAGALKSINDIELVLCGTPYENMDSLPNPNPTLQKALNNYYAGLNPRYSVTLCDITSGKPVAYAERNSKKGYQPGSVGKLAVVTAFFTEIENLFPNSFEKRRILMRDKYVRAGGFALYDHHTVPLFDTLTYKFQKRTVIADDVFSLYEWLDHMLSVSNNGAASVVWREAILMRAFGKKYPEMTENDANIFFKETRKDSLARLAESVINTPLRKLGIEHDEWRLGSMFTRGATAIVPPRGGSIGTPAGLMKWMLALERGAIIDYESSLEIKRLCHITDRRIRYAASPSLDSAAVCFKSGSLYGCLPDSTCEKYAGNRMNYMNSVAIIEQPNGRKYLVCLMSNVLGKNSNFDHRLMAQKIDKIVAARIEE